MNVQVAKKIFRKIWLSILLLTFSHFVHASIQTSNNKHVNTVRVVYFYAADVEAPQGWSNRLDRILRDISSYYKEELENSGVKSSGIPFETENSGYRYHLVQGCKPSADYNINSGTEIEKEIFEKLAPVMNPSIEHILVITSLNYKNEKGTYVFHSPYYGRGSASSGLCMVADCELLAPEFLSDSTTKMVFTEMFATDKECSVGEFNSWYLGGIAHEMGHLFGLPHDNGFPGEFNKNKISLMGEYGSRHYKEEKWGGIVSSKLSRASVFQLSSHPIFTQRPKSIYNKNEFLLQSYNLSLSESKTKLKLYYHADTIPYGAVTLVRPYHISEYLSSSYITVIDQRNSAEIDISGFELNTPHEIRILFLFNNGSIKEYRKMILHNDGGHFLTLDNYGQATVNDLIRLIERDDQHSQRQTKLKLLHQLLQDQTPVSLDNTNLDSIFLSDAKWDDASVGWENPARNFYTTESNKLFFLESNGKIFNKGLYAHSPSVYKYSLARKWKKLHIMAALRDGAHKPEGIQFFIRGNGKILSSHNVKPDEQHCFDLDVTEIDDLELCTQDRTGNNFNAWSIWCEPQLTR
ncbi:NPCBM/NEW2 domain-containing protein [Sphingobacterium thalpophilum]|uniref:NPCBM/NEW2 domain-containing protein n=1 Tax=Sphingobacterium thalpophilum TaxID=259 RepID=UPI0024A651D6|nr:NPCBM/NEW2 domain-containing protein [Sphingobacterium thalpophilum]